MTDAYIWLTMAGMGAVTFATRLLPIVLLEKLHPHNAWQRALRFVPPAVLAAIIVPELTAGGYALLSAAGAARLVAAALAAIVAWRTPRVLYPIGTGRAVLWLLQAAMSGQAAPRAAAAGWYIAISATARSAAADC